MTGFPYKESFELREQGEYNLTTVQTRFENEIKTLCNVMMLCPFCDMLSLMIPIVCQTCDNICYVKGNVLRIILFIMIMICML